MKIKRKALTGLLTVLCVAAGAVETTEQAVRSCVRDDLPNENWLDRSYVTLSKTVCGPSIWFDRFFGDDLDEEESAGTQVRVIAETAWSENDDFEFKGRINARFELPRLKRRWHLVVSGDSERNPLDRLRDEGDASSGLALNESDDSQSSLALRYDALNRPQAKFQINAGVRGASPLEPFVRSRYRYTYPFNDFSLARLTQTVFWRSDDGFGTSLQLDYERRLSSAMLLRWSSSGVFSETSDGVEWGSNVSLFRQLSEKSAVSFDAGLTGLTRPESAIDDYRVGLRYRRNVYRPWLFVELEPSLSWPLEDGEREPNPAISLRLEALFGRL